MNAPKCRTGARLGSTISVRVGSWSCGTLPQPDVLLVSQGPHWLQAGGAVGGDEAGAEGDQGQNDRRGPERDRVVALELEEDRARRPAEADRGGQSERAADD